MICLTLAETGIFYSGNACRTPYLVGLLLVGLRIYCKTNLDTSTKFSIFLRILRFQTF